MRLSDLLGRPVLDSSGREIGVVYDLRATHAVEPATAGRRGSFSVVALVVGNPGVVDLAAHAWGFAEGRAAGPWVLRRLTRRAVERSLLVAAELVASWDGPAVRLTVEREQLSPLKEAISNE